MTIDSPKISHITALRTLWQEAFGDSDEFLDAFEKTAFSYDRCRCVTLEGRIVAALYWFECSCRSTRVAYLYAVATAKDYRGRGICSALMDDTHRHLKSIGYDGVVLVPGSGELFDFYERFGYRTFCSVNEFRCAPLSGEHEIRKIEADEYARMRRLFLPEGGVVQENENLDFLQTQVAFYAGKDFLMAAGCKDGVLYCVELLGDVSCAPAVVRLLGCSEGHFRAPNGDKPFAMYLSLADERCDLPSYFGLAFD